MSSVSAILGQNFVDHPMKKQFLKWQCLTRQIMMRDSLGRPDDAIMPLVSVVGLDEPLGHIITILNKLPDYSKVLEMLHLARKTNDPAQRRDQALDLLSATYYQKAGEFSDVLTSTFQPGSTGAAMLSKSGRCRLHFEAYGQSWRLDCKVWRLSAPNQIHIATIAHNRLFNPDLPGSTIVLGFEPDWDLSEQSNSRR